MNGSFGLPPEVFTPEFAEYSNQSKLLFAIVLSEAENAKSLKDLAGIIQKFGDRKLSSFIRELRNTAENSEG